MMDDLQRKLAIEAAHLFELKRLQKQKEDLEKIPKPQREKVSLADWRKQREAKLQGQLDTMMQGLVKKSFTDLKNDGIYSNERLLDRVFEAVQKEPLKFAYPTTIGPLIPSIEKALEETIYQESVDRWEKRFGPVNGLLQPARNKAGKPFHPSLINVDPRFPVERIGWQDNKPYDRWLTEGLKERKPVFFEPHEKWEEKMIQFYEKVYVPEQEGRSNSQEVSVNA
jgi:hypothetical protein